MTQPLSNVDYSRNFNINNGTNYQDSVIKDESEFNSLCGIVKTKLDDNTTIFLTINSHQIDDYKGKSLEDLYNENKLLSYSLDTNNDGQEDYTCHIDKEDGNTENVFINDSMVTYVYNNENNLTEVKEQKKDEHGNTQVYTDENLSGNAEKSKTPNVLRGILATLNIANYINKKFDNSL